jgi:hypothetical protein
MPCVYAIGLTDSLLIQNEVNVVMQWFVDNLLLINVSKTNLVMFSNHLPVAVPTILVNQKVLSFVTSVKFLGCCIDRLIGLNGIFIFNLFVIVSVKGIVMLCSVCKCFPVYVKLILYYSMIYPNLSYAIAVWGNAPRFILIVLLFCKRRRYVYY